MTSFSVIIPTYNRGPLLLEAVDSVLRQTHQAFEVLIVDDGSTDNTRQLVQEQYSGNDKVRYLYKENGERGAARNHGLQHANGDFGVFFDSDDWMKPDYLEILNNVIQKHPKVNLLAARYVFRNEEGKESPSGLFNYSPGWYERSFFLMGNILACNYAVRIKGYDYKPFPPDRELASMEDWLFILENTEKNKVFISGEVGIVMREHDERSMSNNLKVIEARRRATEYIIPRLKLRKREENILRGWSHYFCGIHFYLDGSGSKALQEVQQAIRLAGINMKFILLSVKSLIGRKWISRLK